MHSVHREPSFTALMVIAIGLLGFVTRTTANDCDGRMELACEPCTAISISGVGDMVDEGKNCPPPAEDFTGCSGFQKVKSVSNLFSCTQPLSNYIGIQKCRPKVVIVVSTTPFGGIYLHAYYEQATCLEYKPCEFDRNGIDCTGGKSREMKMQVMKTYYCDN